MDRNSARGSVLAVRAACTAKSIGTSSKNMIISLSLILSKLDRVGHHKSELPVSGDRMLA